MSKSPKSSSLLLDAHNHRFQCIMLTAFQPEALREALKYSSFIELSTVTCTDVHVPMVATS